MGFVVFDRAGIPRASHMGLADRTYRLYDILQI